MTLRRVVVTGLGVVSPLGDDADAMFGRLMRGESAVRLVSFEGEKPYENVAAPADFKSADSLPSQPRIDNLDRVTRFSIAAAAQAVQSAGITFTDENRYRSGVAFGTGMGAAHALDETFRQVLLRDPDRVRPLTVLKVMNNAPAAHIAIQYGLGGPDLTYSSACSSSAVAIGEAYREIRHGYADVMIAGGAEAALTFTFFKAWDAMQVLAPIDRTNPSASCKPFDRQRAGLVLGEGAAFVILEERESALRRGATIQAEMAGYGSSNDYAHITKPSVDGQAHAISMALADGGLSAGDVDYVNAHGTGTLLNDTTETEALKKVFGSRAHHVPVSSTKSMHGHLLGGAGALEFVVALLALRHGAIPPTAHLDSPDPACDLDYVPHTGRSSQDIRCVMSSSFAFGGTNAVLLARRH